MQAGKRDTSNQLFLNHAHIAKGESSRSYVSIKKGKQSPPLLRLRGFKKKLKDFCICTITLGDWIRYKLHLILTKEWCSPFEILLKVFVAHAHVAKGESSRYVSTTKGKQSPSPQRLRGCKKNGIQCWTEYGIMN